MTVVRSAAGTRIDCDACDEHAGSPDLSIEVLRRVTGYVSHGDRDWCPSCWKERTASQFHGTVDPPPDDGPAAA